MEDRDNEVVFGKYTRKELHDAFTSVQNRINWKMPIDAVIPASGIPFDDAALLSKITHAIQFFTASTPLIVQEGAHWRIKAVGYYEAVGA